MTEKQKEKLTLAQALKIKKRLLKEINDLKSKLARNNSYLKGAKVHYNTKEILEKLKEKKVEYIALKELINKTNAPIYRKIYLLSEYKDLISILQSMSTAEGLIYRYKNEEPQEYEVCIDELEREKEIKSLEEKIETTQDELDQFNHTTFIEV